MKTPGHSENHAAFVLDEEQSIFSGDHVLGYGTTIMSDLYDYMASLQAMQAYSPVRLYPGHGPFITDGVGLLSRYRVHREAREKQIVEFLAEAGEAGEGVYLPTALDIAEALYTSTTKQRMAQARENVERVLLKLWRGGQAECFSDREGRVKALLPAVGYMRRLGGDLAWRLIEQTDAATTKWEEAVESIVAAATNPPSRLVRVGQARL